MPDLPGRASGSGSPEASEPPGGAEPRARDLFAFTRALPLDRAGELLAAIQQLSLARSLPEIQSVVRHAARHLTGADGATFVLRDGDDCLYADEDAIAPLWKGQRFSAQTCISGWVIHNRRPAVIADVYEDARIRHDVYRPTFVHGLAVVPIRQSDPVGAIGNYWASRHIASDQELQTLQALADSTAVALETVHTYQQLEDSRLDTLNRLALAAEFRDDGTHEHTRRVARTAFLLARELGMTPAEASLIRQAAPLHDLGKLALPDAILLKRARLTVPEYERVKQHPAAGAAVLSGSASQVMRMAEQIALTHHEWWDGSGYPAGLAGQEIPLGGRLVALADVFDALTHTRPYKRAWPVERALGELRRLAGTQFDPAVVEAFFELDPSALVELPRARARSARQRAQPRA
ncbi:MAG: HD domain-containing protein [Solirubrobacterales bacterium]|nr:HD domain-containing protein [Solirubrobacterales bacterium]